MAADGIQMASGMKHAADDGLQVMSIGLQTVEGGIWASGAESLALVRGLSVAEVVWLPLGLQSEDS